MATHDTIAGLRKHLGALRAATPRRDRTADSGGGVTVGLVPTMGYLHEGHQQLIARAAAECEIVVTTIFVNPLQFAPGEDLDSYPRDPIGDAAKASEAGTTILFVPRPGEMYPDGPDAVLTTVSVAELGALMEGASRPTHLAGVCTVVAKLFNIIGSCRAYFGEKDYQQLASITSMAADLSFPVEVIGCATERESDGLARSSRNAYLSPREREVAPVLHDALVTGARMIAAGETDPERVRRAMAALVEAAPLGELDYVEVADQRALQPAEVADPTVRLFGAVRFGRARLIDNIGVTEAATGDPRGTVVDGA